MRLLLLLMAALQMVVGLDSCRPTQCDGNVDLEQMGMLM